MSEYELVVTWRPVNRFNTPAPVSVVCPWGHSPLGKSRATFMGSVEDLGAELWDRLVGGPLDPDQEETP